jgi:hypothetical protein
MVASHRNRSEQRFARMLAASEGIKYTEALRRVRAFQSVNEKKEESEVTYHIHNAEGEDIAGDRELTDGLKKMADEVNGYIIDDQTGKQVYPEVEEEDVPLGD